MYRFLAYPCCRNVLLSGYCCILFRYRIHSVLRSPRCSHRRAFTKSYKISSPCTCQCSCKSFVRGPRSCGSRCAASRAFPACPGRVDRASRGGQFHSHAVPIYSLHLATGNVPNTPSDSCDTCTLALVFITGRRRREACARCTGCVVTILERPPAVLPWMCFPCGCDSAALAATGCPEHGATTAVGCTYPHRALLTQLSGVLRHIVARLGLEFRTPLPLAVYPLVAVLPLCYSRH